MAIFAHPDDIEFLCAGTLKLLAQRGWRLRCVTLSGGDLGAVSGSREELRHRRLQEAAASAAILGGDHRWAGLDDLQIVYGPDAQAKVTEQIRAFAPDLIITHSPNCYHLDHEECSRLARGAAFAASVPLYRTASPATNGIPALYYADAFEGRDVLGRPVMASFYVDIGSVFEVRRQALLCHESQREWLREQHGEADYLDTCDQLALLYGRRCGVRYAEGFRQHLGHAHPQENRLATELAEFVKLPVERD
jgi:LmbE family N-acetylglucosaminyl deacetylase